MRPTLLVFRREFAAYFATPVAAVFLIVFLALSAGMTFLVSGFFDRGQADLSGFFFWHPWLYLVLMPAIAMRLWAEERRSGTIETLMTAPVSSAAVVLAKYAAVMTTYVAMWAPTTLYLVILGRTGALDWHAAASAYLGILLVGAGYLAIGLCASALTRSQFLAMLWTALVLLVLFILGVGEFVTREGSTMHAVCSHVSVWAHMQDFASGIVDSRRLVFYGSLTLLPLYVATRAVDAWRWG